MVAPLIVGAARVVGTGKVTTRTARGRKKERTGSSESNLQNSPVRGFYRSRAKNREKGDSEPSEHQSTQRRTPFIQGVRPLDEKRRMLEAQKRVEIEEESEEDEGGSSLIQTARRAKAILVGSTILWVVLPFYFVQILFWLLSLGGIGLETAPIAKVVFPGTELFLLAYSVIGVIGLGSMLFGLFMFKSRFVHCLDGYKGIIFLGCLTGYFVFFINFIPFVALWVLSVMFMQKKGGGEEED